MLYIHIYHTYLKYMHVLNQLITGKQSNLYPTKNGPFLRPSDLRSVDPQRASFFIVLIWVPSGNQIWLAGKWTIYQ